MADRRMGWLARIPNRAPEVSYADFRRSSCCKNNIENTLSSMEGHKLIIEDRANGKDFPKGMKRVQNNTIRNLRGEIPQKDLKILRIGTRHRDVSILEDKTLLIKSITNTDITKGQGNTTALKKLNTGKGVVGNRPRKMGNKTTPKLKIHSSNTKRPNPRALQMVSSAHTRLLWRHPESG